MAIQLTPTSFRLATLTLEFIERHKLSLEAAFLKAVRRERRREGGALKLARIALLKFGEADLLLTKLGAKNLPIRRKCAFRVAYAAVAEGIAEEPPSVGVLSGKLRKLLTRRSIEKVKREVESMNFVDKLAYRYSFPKWLVRELVVHLGESETEKLVKSCLKRTIWLRINELKASKREVLRVLHRTLTVREDRDFPELVEVVGVEDVPDQILRLVAKGIVVVQDKGSVAVVHAMELRKKILVLDAAAAPGLKTSLIQQLTRNEAEVIAVDVSGHRIKTMKTILRKLGVSNVNIVRSDSRTAAFFRKFDRILVDAPCTNSGAIASDPALRLALWKKPPLKEYAQRQKEILANSLQHLSTSGVLVYSTCSLAAEEGEKVIDSVIADGYGLSVEKIIGLPGYRGYSCWLKVRRLYPHVHRTTGFFIAKLVHASS